MSFDFNNSGSSSGSSGGSHFGGLGDRHKGHPAVILKRAIMDGNVKIFADSTGGSEKTVILTPEGMVVVYKDFEVLPTMSQYKKIDILSIEEELRGTLELIARDRSNPRPAYRVYYERSEIGSASGDIAGLLVSKLLGGSADTNAGVGSDIDDEVVNTIKRVLQSKR